MLAGRVTDRCPDPLHEKQFIEFLPSFFFFFNFSTNTSLARWQAPRLGNMSNDRRIRGISNIGTQRGPSRFSIEASAAARRAEEQRARSNENSFNFEPPQQQPGSPPLYRPKPQRSWGPLAAAPHPADGGGTRVNYGRRGTDDSDPGVSSRCVHDSEWINEADGRRGS